MALRVLLADESTTIKKVMQLALHDYGVDVKSVPIGLDVVPVAKGFMPDIVFVDVLLQKRSGYEVVQELKKELPHLPVVLMWSGFMELDEAKAVACGADRRLEKPFDSENLRSLIKDLVERTAGNSVAEYLSFPPLPDFAEDPEPVEAEPEEPMSFGETPSRSNEIYAIPEAAPEENWSHQDLSQFKVQTEGEFEEVTFSPGQLDAVSPASSAAPLSAAAGPTRASSAFDDVVAEKILREEASKLLEKMIWQVLPEIAERVVKEELNKLLKDAERSIETR